MTTLKLPRLDARLDAIVSYVTDVNPLILEHKQYFSGSHPDGEAFATALVNAGMDVLKKSATAAREREEAKAATQGQRDAVTTARALVTEVRRRGAYVVAELQRRPDKVSQANARDVRVACGIGSRISIGSQTGLRRMLAVQTEGLLKVNAVFQSFLQPDLLPRLEAASDALQATIQAQSKEQVETDMAEDHLEAAVAQALEELHRAIRLVNAMGDAVPVPLRTGLRTVEGKHHAVFFPLPGAGALEDDDPELDVAAPAEPVALAEPA